MSEDDLERDRTVSDVLIERLAKEWGVDTVFGLPGDAVNGFVEGLRAASESVRHIHVRNEEVGALAAVGQAKFTGELGVVYTTAGPGAAHAVNGALDATMEQAPLLILTGMTYHDLVGTEHIQGNSTDYLFNNITIFNERIMGPSHVETMVDRACRAALSERGAAHLTIPRNFQSRPIADAQPSSSSVPRRTSASYESSVQVPPQAALEEAAALLNDHDKIAILAGAGANGAGNELEALAETLGAPIGKGMLGKQCIPDDNPYVTGAVAHAGSHASNLAYSECDAFVIVGSTMPFLGFYPEPDQVVTVQIDDKSERIGLRIPVDRGLVGDVKATLDELVPLLERTEDRSFVETAQERTEQWWQLMEERGTRTDEPMKPQVPVWYLSELLDEDAIICGDAGTVTYWAARQICLHDEQKFSMSGTNCSMTSGLSYAIGAQLAYPDRQIVALTGDGSITMQLGDFLTCVQYELPITIVVIQNDTVGLERWEQILYLGNPEYGNDLVPLNLVKFAEACGGDGVRIEDPMRCQEQLEEALDTDGPVIVEAVVDPHEPVVEAPIPDSNAENYAAALERGTADREQIAETMLRELQREEEITPDAITESTTQLMEHLREVIPEDTSE